VAAAAAAALSGLLGCSSRSWWFFAAPALKFLTLSVLGVPTCFLLGYGLTRLPGVSRVL
jgi:hypothetical protein